MSINKGFGAPAPAPICAIIAVKNFKNSSSAMAWLQQGSRALEPWSHCPEPKKTPASHSGNWLQLQPNCLALLALEPFLAPAL